MSESNITSFFVGVFFGMFIVVIIMFTVAIPKDKLLEENLAHYDVKTGAFTLNVYTNSPVNLGEAK